VNRSLRILTIGLLGAAGFVGFNHSSAVMAQEAAAAAKVSDQEKAETITVFDMMTLTIPEAWKTEAPKSSIVQHEYSLTKPEGEDAAGATRITMMAAGGGVEPNIKRWEGQFSEGPEAKVEKFDAAGQKVHFVEIEGTFKESMGGGPFSGGKTVMQKDYMMLGGIIELANGRMYFIKLTGPKSEAKPQAEAFKKMLKEMKPADQ
jgi:hypothetical protein